MQTIGKSKNITTKNGFDYFIKTQECPGCNAKYYSTSYSPYKEVSFFCEYCGFMVTYKTIEDNKAFRIPIFQYKIGEYTYALWRNQGFLFSDHSHLIDVIHVKTKKFLFWKWKSVKMIAVFKIKKRDRTVII